MSSATACSPPAARAMCAPPIAPPAMPESSRCAGRSRASCASACPPFDFSSDQRPATPCSVERGRRRRPRSARRAASCTRRPPSWCRARTRARSARSRARARPAGRGSARAAGRRRRPLVLGVEVGEEQADGHRDRAPAVRREARLDELGERRRARSARARRPPRRPARRRRGSRGGALSGVGLRQCEVVVVLAVDALDVRDVLEALGREVERRARPCGCSTALMPIVVPTTTKLDVGRVEARGRRAPAAIAATGLPGFDGTFATYQRPVASSTATRSVNVPPVSIPTLTPMRATVPATRPALRTKPSAEHLGPGPNCTHLGPGLVARRVHLGPGPSCTARSRRREACARASRSDARGRGLRTAGGRAIGAWPRLHGRCGV